MDIFKDPIWILYQPTRISQESQRNLQESSRIPIVIYRPPLASLSKSTRVWYWSSINLLESYRTAIGLYNNPKETFEETPIVE